LGAARGRACAARGSPCSPASPVASAPQVSPRRKLYRPTRQRPAPLHARQQTGGSTGSSCARKLRAPPHVRAPTNPCCPQQHSTSLFVDATEIFQDSNLRGPTTRASLFSPPAPIVLCVVSTLDSKMHDGYTPICPAAEDCISLCRGTMHATHKDFRRIIGLEVPVLDVLVFVAVRQCQAADVF